MRAYPPLSAGAARPVLMSQGRKVTTMSDTTPATLEPGVYFDCTWGIYNIPRTIIMAYEAWQYTGSHPNTRPCSPLQYVRACRAWEQEDSSLIDEDMQNAADSSEYYLTSHHCPEGYYFGTNPDTLDVGVWPQEEEQ